MGLEKQIVVDKIEVFEDGTIQVRESTRIIEDGVVISKQNTNRMVIEPDQDITNESQEIKNIAGIVRTPERLERFAAKKAALKESLGKDQAVKDA